MVVVVLIALVVVLAGGGSDLGDQVVMVTHYQTERTQLSFKHALLPCSAGCTTYRLREGKPSPLKRPAE